MCSATRLKSLPEVVDQRTLFPDLIAEVIKQDLLLHEPNFKLGYALIRGLHWGLRSLHRFVGAFVHFLSVFAMVQKQGHNAARSKLPGKVP